MFVCRAVHCKLKGCAWQKTQEIPGSLICRVVRVGTAPGWYVERPFRPVDEAEEHVGNSDGAEDTPADLVVRRDGIDTASWPSKIATSEGVLRLRQFVKRPHHKQASFIHSGLRLPLLCKKPEPPYAKTHHLS